MASLHLRISLSSLLLLPFVAATCYNPDGSIVTDHDFQPCVFTSGAVSMCCATNRAQLADECLPNGLCHNTCTDAGICGDSTGGQYWRESCTDPSWQSPFCLRACTNPSTGGAANSTSAMSQCSTDGSWCCGGDLTSEACCAMNNRVILAARIGVSSSTTSTSTTTPSTTSTSLTSSSALGPTSASSLTPTPAPPPSHSDAGKKAGIGVGVGVGVLTLAALVAFFLLRRRRGRRQARDDILESSNGFEKPELSGIDSIKLGYDTTCHGVSAAPGEYLHQELDDHRMLPQLGRPELQGMDAKSPHEMPATPREQHVLNEIHG